MNSGRTVIEEVKDRLNIVDIVGSRVELRRSGKNFQGLCPFHQEKTPSFVVFPERQTYHCFGCGKGGDIISFVMEQEGLDFKDALRQLAERAGVRYEPKAPAPEEEQAHERLHEINRLAARFFNHLLLTSDSAATARAYLEQRGIPRESWDTWMLGYAPNSWDATYKFLEGRGFSSEEILQAGLVVEREGGGQYDRFRDRLMFPIRDRGGQFIAFGGRAIGEGTPKYLNSPESPIFTKGEQLYGLDLAQEPVRAEGRIVLVEGYVDVVVAHAYGFRNVVASLGTALTPAHVRILSKLARTVCLALDADAAGDAAALRGWEVLRDSVRRRRIPIKSRGRVVASDQKMDLDVRIARLPRGEDPDTLIRKDPEQWRKLIDDARTVIEHFFLVVEETVDLSTPEGRTQAVAELAPVVAELGNPVELAHYEERLARLARADQHEIQGVVARSRRGQARGAPEYAGIRVVSLEERLMALLLRYPKLLEDLPEDLPELEKAENREVYGLIRSIPPEKMTQEALMEAADGPLREHILVLMGLVELQPELLSNEQPLELERLLGMIRRRQLEQMISQHTLLIQEANELGDPEAVRALLGEVSPLASGIRQFDPPRSPYFKDSRG